MFRRPLAAGEVLHFHTPPIRPGPRRALLFAQVSAAASGPQVRRRTSSGRGGFDGAGTLFRRSRLTQEILWLNAQFDGDVPRVQPDAEATLEAAEIARICLEGVRETLAEMTGPS